MEPDLASDIAKQCKLHQVSRAGANSNNIILPDIIYPVRLSKYEFSEELASCLFFQAFKGKELKFDREEVFEIIRSKDNQLTEIFIGAHPNIINQNHILTICSYKTAAEFLINQCIERDKKIELKEIKISLLQLCKQIRKVNNQFTFSFSSKTSKEDQKKLDGLMSPTKAQREFCEDMMSEIFVHDC